MKSRTQKEQELAKAEKLLAKSETLVFLDFSGVDTERMRLLRNEIRDAGGAFFVLKKRLLRLLMKKGGVDFDPTELEGMVGTVFFSGNLEEASGPIYRFFAGLGEDAESKKQNVAKILGAYELKDGRVVDAMSVIQIGQLPPREVMLGQLLGTIAAPIRGFLYILSERANPSASSG